MISFALTIIGWGLIFLSRRFPDPGEQLLAMATALIALSVSLGIALEATVGLP